MKRIILTNDIEIEMIYLHLLKEEHVKEKTTIIKARISRKLKLNIRKKTQSLTALHKQQLLM